MESTWDASEIVPGLYLGSEEAGIDESELRSRNITHVIVPAFTGSEARPHSERLRYLQLYVADVPGFPLLPLLSTCCERIDEARREGGAVLLHCAQGRSRSAAVAIAYVMHSTNCDFEAAKLHVSQRRRIACKFEDQLKLWKTTPPEQWPAVHKMSRKAIYDWKEDPVWNEQRNDLK